MALLSRTGLFTAARLPSANASVAFSTLAERFYNEEQKKLKEITLKLIESEINPYADQVRMQP